MSRYEIYKTANVAEVRLIELLCDEISAGTTTVVSFDGPFVKDVDSKVIVPLTHVSYGKGGKSILENKVVQERIHFNRTDSHVNTVTLSDPWNASVLPSFPEFKKQILLPVQEAIKTYKNIILVDSAATNCLRSKLFVLLDICTGDNTADRNAESGPGDNNSMLPVLESSDDAADRQIIRIERRPFWQLLGPLGQEESVGGEKVKVKRRGQQSTARVTGEMVRAQAAEYLQLAADSLGWADDLSAAHLDFLARMVCAVVRERHVQRSIRSLPDKIHRGIVRNLDASSSSSSSVFVGGDAGAVADGAGQIRVASPAGQQTVKPLPSADTGLSVLEFFSGIGGMRLGLPPVIRGIPVKRVTAFDCSTVANDVYHHNFEGRDPSLPRLDSVEGTLRRITIDGLRLGEVDGVADIWTMSPPCQPYTTTKGALRRDQLDNRSRGIFHLMDLLLHMKRLPRWIVLENVRGFTESNVLQLWKRVMRRCGYAFRQYLLSPETCVGLPNCRKRYYFVAEHRASVGSRFLAELSSAAVGAADSSTDAPGETDLAEVFGGSDEEGSSSAVLVNAAADSDDDDGDDSAVFGSGGQEQDSKRMRLEEEDDRGDTSGGAYIVCKDGELLHTVLPPHIAALHPSMPRTIGEVLAVRNQDNAVTHIDSLLLPDRVLTAPWAADSLSIVSPFDRVSYCFTKGYGRIYDRSTGSCYYPLPYATGPLSDAAHRLDRADLSVYKGKLRLFDPDEILLLSGFPSEFGWPGNTSMQRRWGCIGNSVNVSVVRAVMQCLFE